MHGRLSRATLVALCIAACQPTKKGAPDALVIVDSEGLNTTNFEIEPEHLPLSVTATPNRLVVEVDAERQSGSLTIRLPGACPVAVDLARVQSGGTLTLKARPYLELGPDLAEVGFDTRFSIEVRPGCPAAERGRVTWKQLQGRALKDVHIEQRGFRYSARTLTHRELIPNPRPGSIVPVSPDSAGRAVLRATLRLENGVIAHDRVTVSAVSRARGLPNVPINARVLLGGEGWSWIRKPPGATATFVSDAGLTWFRPRVSGRWVLADAAGHQLSVQSAGYSSLPLDCGRAGCHDDSRFGSVGAMQTVMSRALAGHFGPSYDPSCAIGCHTIGEPGLEDGGFDDVARQLGFRLGPQTHASMLPPALERLSNVGCLACHGPGTIPEPSARWSILSADVCAYCHDQPDRYNHVAKWKTNAMSRADRDKKARSLPECVRCHTTWGFLALENSKEELRRPPDDAVLGVACVACHDVHQVPSTAALVRRRPNPPLAFGLSKGVLESSAICLGCHAEDRPLVPPSRLPFASAAAIFAGNGGFDRRGRPLGAPGVHTAVARGCLACHGHDHSFVAKPSACRDCHSPLQRDESLQEGARALWSRLEERGAVRALSATAAHTKLQFSKPSNREKLAAYDVSLVLLDAAADVHNPAYARLLLEEAEGMLRDTKGGDRR